MKIFKIEWVRWCIGVSLAVVGVTMASHAVAWFGTDTSDERPAISAEQAQTLIKEGKGELVPKANWREILSEDQFKILWEKGTERAFTGELLNENREGVFVTAGCKVPVFSSKHKFKSGTGWPSFWDILDSGNIVLKEDRSWGMRRVEVLSKCGEHLGHVFTDGPEPTGKRYCINSRALEFVPSDNDASEYFD